MPYAPQPRPPVRFSPTAPGAHRRPPFVRAVALADVDRPLPIPHRRAEGARAKPWRFGLAQRRYPYVDSEEGALADAIDRRHGGYTLLQLIQADENSAPACASTIPTMRLHSATTGGGRMPPDPTSRVELARNEIDRVFGKNYADEHPEVVAAVVVSIALDFAAQYVGAAIMRAADWESEPELAPAPCCGRKPRWGLARGQ